MNKCFFIITLSSIAVPGTNGFIGEFLILMGAFKKSFLVAVIASIGVILSAAYMLWMYKRVVFGKITTGASNDLQRATDIAEQMVGTFGMSDILGPLAYDKQGGGQFLGNGNNPRRSVSDATAQAIDKEVRDLVDDAHETALNILRNNLPLLESISQKILQEEVIEGEDLKNLLAESKMPA